MMHNAAIFLQAHVPHTDSSTLHLVRLTSKSSYEMAVGHIIRVSLTSVTQCGIVALKWTLTHSLVFSTLPPLSVQEVFFLRTSPSWPQCAPSPASSLSCCPFTMGRESSSWVLRWDAHLSSCMRIRLVNQPRRTTPCSALSTLLTESTSSLKHALKHTHAPFDSQLKLIQKERVL